MVSKRPNRVWRWLLSGAALCAAMASAAPATQTRVLCAADADGALRVLVLMPPSRWPAGGFRVDRHGATLTRIEPDASARAQLSPADAQALARLPQRARAGNVPAAATIIYARLLSDWRFARAAGMATAIPAAGRGQGVVRLQPLTATAQPSGIALDCHPGPATAPPAPGALRAHMGEDGAALFWRPLTGQRAVPVLSFRVYRGRTAGGASITPQAPLLLASRRADTPAYIDSLAPLEQTLTYQVTLVDALGREGPKAGIVVYTRDLTALRPPAHIEVHADGDTAVLAWPRSDNPHTAGYVVERAFLATGPFELLTPKALPVGHAGFRDSGLHSGTVYYYRVRAMGPRGDLGSPSDPVALQPRAGTAPPSPRGLVADVGGTRVRLRWQPLDASVAGYIIERRAAGSSRWSRLNAELWSVPRYDDALGVQAGGRFSYRVVAVSRDNRDSKPSKEITVTLRDRVPPLPPRIVAASGADGHVTLQLQAAAPQTDTAHIYVLRSGAADAPGLVLGKPLAGNASHFEDDWVQPGATYWYHLVAYDAAGNRSVASDAVSVRVGAPSMPQPKAPEAHFESQPLARVVLAFASPPAGLAVLVQRSVDGEHWQAVAGPTTQSPAQDLSPLSGTVRYRIRYRATDGSIGPVSTAVTVAPALTH